MPDTPENAQDDVSTALGELAAAARKMAASQPAAVAASVAGQAARGEKREENIAERLARQSAERAWAQVPPAGNDVGTGQPLPVIPKDMDFAAFQAQQRAARGEGGPPKPEGVVQKPQSPLEQHLRERYPDRGDKWYQAVQQKAASGQQGPPRPDLSKPEYGDLNDDDTPRTDRPQPAPVDLLDRPNEEHTGTYGFADGGEAKAAADPPQQHESVRLLTEIRDGIRALTKKAATGEAKPAKGPDEPAEEDSKSSTLMDLFRASPLGDGRTKIGRLITRAGAVSRLAKKFFPKTFGGGKTPASPPTGGNGGGKPPKAPPGGKGGTPAPGGKGKKPTGFAALPTGAKVAAVAVGATAALVALGKAAVHLGYQMEGEARRLAEVSPSQAANVTILDAQRTVRDFEKGEATAGSSGQLLETLNRLEKAAQPFLVASTNVMNTFTAAVINPIADIVEVGENILEVVKKIPVIGALLDGPPNDQGELLGRFLDAVHKDQQKKAQDAQNRINAARNANPRRLP